MSMFKAVKPKPDFPKMEESILKFWEKEKCFQKLQEQNAKSKKRWSFIDGPITANNKMGVHHAWGRTLKDLYQRFRAMQGYDQRWQNGFDCQGLWVEVGTEKDLGLKTKKDIEKLGLDKFSRENRKRVDKYSAVQTEQSIRLGQWMDWENSYYTMSDNNIEHIWYFLKKIQEKKWLYKGWSAMPWCARCGTAISQHELTEDDAYKEVTDQAAFVLFPLKDKKDENLLVWTTTPWTLAANSAAAVNPDFTYIKAEQDGKIMYLFEDLADVVLGAGKYKVLEKLRGKDLEGWQYQGPFDELPGQQNIKHQVVVWKEVGEDEGTGIVHIAPSAGAEDYELSKEKKIEPVPVLDENGEYLEGFDWLTGRRALEVAKDVLADLEKKKILYKKENYLHRYPHCWRCNEPLVFRLVDEWFIKMDDLRPTLKKNAAKVKWRPDYAGKRMQDWLDNMGDWIISRKRYWGLPLPFYPCECGEVTVAGSREELKKLAVDPGQVDKLPELHRPWIDEVKIKCPKCDQEVKRVKDVGDCWLDAGIVPFSTLDYLTDKKKWQKWFPAELVLEGLPQIKLWFYSMLVMATVLEEKLPYLAAGTHQMVVDEKGEEMHKSKGNAIWFDGAVEKMGADVMRWLYAASPPERNLRFGFSIGDEYRRRLLLLWNVYAYLVTYANEAKEDLSQSDYPDALKLKNPLDRWLLGRLDVLVQSTTQSLEKVDAPTAMSEIDKFIEDLSTWYIRRSRERFGRQGNSIDRRDALGALYHAVLTITKLLAPFTPFVAEEIYQNLKGAQDQISVHLTAWPESQGNIDEQLISEMDQAIAIVRLGRSAREQNNLKLKQPLAAATVVQANQADLPEHIKDLIKDELNVAELKLAKDTKGLAEEKVQLDFAKAGQTLGKAVPEVKKQLEAGDYKVTSEGCQVGAHLLKPGEYKTILEPKEDKAVAGDRDMMVALDTKMTDELRSAGMVREIIRAIQKLRKDAGLKISDRINVVYETDSGVFKQVIPENKKEITEKVLADTISFLDKQILQQEAEFSQEVLIGKWNITLGIRKNPN